MITGTGRYQNWREKAANGAEDRQYHGVLQDRKNTRERGQCNEKCESERRRHNVVQSEGGKNRQVQHADTTALQTQGVHRQPLPEPPADGKQDTRQGSHREVPRFDRDDDIALVNGIPQEKSNAEKGNDDTELDWHIASRQPLFRHLNKPVDRAGNPYYWRDWFCFGNKGCRRRLLDRLLRHCGRGRSNRCISRRCGRRRRFG